MQHYTNSVIAFNGDRVANATITVTDLSGNAVTIYQDYAGTTPLTSTTTNNNGEFDFYVPAGRYNITATGVGISGYTISDEFIGIADSSVSPFIQAGTGAVSRTIQDKLEEFISVKDFGAVGDGVTNDAAAVQLAANAAAGKVLYFPPGTYVVNNGFSITGDNSVVIGYGATITYNATTATFYHCIRIYGNNTAVLGIRVKSPSGLVRNDTGFAISAGNVSTNTTGLVIQDCVVDSIGSAGIWLSNVSQPRIANNVVKNCLADGIHFADGCYDIVCSNNVLISNGDDNIAIVNDTAGAPYLGRFVVSGNVITGGTSVSGMGVAVIGAATGNIIGNTISNTVGPAIGTYHWTDTGYNADYLSISDNVINNTGVGGTYFGGCGIYLGETNNVSIKNNHIANLQYDGAKTCGAIVANVATQIDVSSNYIYNISCDGITSVNPITLTIDSNRFGYSTRTPILISGANVNLTVGNNVFRSGTGTNDIDVNITGSSIANVFNNSATNAVTVTAPSQTLSRNELQTYTPTITSGSGSITTASGTLTYQRVGKFIYCDLSVTITTNGTGAGYIAVTLPFTANGGMLSGRENALTGVAVSGTPSTSNLIIRKYDNSYPGATGATFTLSGLLRVA